jgi:CTD small phosphatase-like protein 2
VLDHLDPGNEFIHHRLFREHCVITEESVYIKDLRVLGNRELKDIVIIDNATYSFGYQIENGIPIVPFYDNKADVELKRLVKYLKSLDQATDVRYINSKTFKFHVFNETENCDKILEKLIEDIAI